MPRKEAKYHFIYKTTCLITNKFYYGMHSTNNLDDGYLGSGRKLHYSIAKHGIVNHKREILEFLPDRKTLWEKEAEIINEELLKNSLCMNIVPGGYFDFRYEINHGSLTGLNHFFNSVKQSQYSGFKNENKEKYGKECADKILAGRIKGSTLGGKKCKELKLGVFSPNYHHSEKTCRKISKHQTGYRNSQYGTCWIHSLEENKNLKIKKENFEEWKNKGWLKGRKMFK